MDDPFGTLEALDPSDSMADTLTAVLGVLDLAERANDASFREKALALIRLKEKEAMDYYLRPLDDDSVYNRLISLNTAAGDDAAVGAYRRALDIRQARRWSILGDAQAVAGNHTKAAKYLKRALFFGPMEDVAHEVRSALERSEKRVQKARKEFEKALSKVKVDEPSSKALKEVGQYLLDLDRTEEAMEFVERWSKDRPEDTDLLYHKGCILLSSGSYDDALGIFQDLKKRLPDSLNVKRCYNWTVQMKDGTI
jgi:tetratricopeptide (TPR) repeat protein